jgi:hypothetical protein
MEGILRNIIKEQNRQILLKIAEKYDKKYEDLERKYLTPSYYSIDIDRSKIYDIKYLESKVTK